MRDTENSMPDKMMILIITNTRGHIRTNSFNKKAKHEPNKIPFCYNKSQI